MDQGQNQERATRHAHEIVLDPRFLPDSWRQPLAAFAGERPPAPDWFTTALANAPERSFVESPRGRIEMLVWGEMGKPGLLFVHGNGANADWWSFIAPFFAADYRVAAFSLAGMGDSDWREYYSSADFALDARDVSIAAGLLNGPRPPIYIGHSFGGMQVLQAAVHQPDHMAGAIIIDSGAGGGSARTKAEIAARVRQSVSGKGVTKLYPDPASAIANFRLMPPQPVENLYIVDHIARHSITPVAGADGQAQGWRWKFDPQNLAKLQLSSSEATGQRGPTNVPLAHVIGTLSPIPGRAPSGRALPLVPDEIQVEIPDSYHHVMIDQPLALVSTIRAILAAWRA